MAILEAPEVDRITKYSSSFDQARRVFSVSFRAVSVYGEEITVEDEELII